MKKKLLWPILIVVFFSQTYFQCGDECFVPDVPIHIAQIRVANLDNRGAEPIVLLLSAEGFSSAYGFRLSMHVLEKQVDTVATTCPFFFAFDPAFTGCEIFTLTGLGSGHPAGSSVSDMFRYVDRHNATTPRYYEIAGAAQSMTFRRFFSEVYDADFLLIDPPPAPGWQQFEIRLTQSDSTTLLLTTDSIYLQ